MKKVKSYVIIEDIKPDDWLFGVSAIDNIIKVKDGNWTPYLPNNEKQHIDFETFGCTNWSSTTAVEILITRLIVLGLISPENLEWLKNNGSGFSYFDDNGKINCSDRFDALGSGTNPKWGNSLKAPAQFKHDFGLIPERMLPMVKDKIKFWDKSDVTQEMWDLGKEFLTRFKINFEVVYEKEFAEALKVSPLAIAVYGWNGVSNGIYIRTENKINHAVTMIKPPEIWNIMDSYNPFIKRLANNFKFLGYAYRYIVTELNVEDNNMNNTIVDEELKDRLYKLILHRKPDPKSSFHEGKALDRVLDAFEQSPEFRFWDGFIRFFKALKPSFIKFGRKKK